MVVFGTVVGRKLAEDWFRCFRFRLHGGGFVTTRFFQKGSWSIWIVVSLTTTNTKPTLDYRCCNVRVSRSWHPSKTFWFWFVKVDQGGTGHWRCVKLETNCFNLLSKPGRRPVKCPGCMISFGLQILVIEGKFWPNPALSGYRGKYCRGWQCWSLCLVGCCPTTKEDTVGIDQRCGLTTLWGWYNGTQMKGQLDAIWRYLRRRRRSFRLFRVTFVGQIDPGCRVGPFWWSIWPKGGWTLVPRWTGRRIVKFPRRGSVGIYCRAETNYIVEHAIAPTGRAVAMSRYLGAIRYGRPRWDGIYLSCKWWNQWRWSLGICLDPTKDSG